MYPEYIQNSQNCQLSKKEGRKRLGKGVMRLLTSPPFPAPSPLIKVPLGLAPKTSHCGEDSGDDAPGWEMRNGCGALTHRCCCVSLDREWMGRSYRI